MKPYIICHMIVSIDGRIDCDMTEQIESGDEYYDVLEKLNCSSMLMGRVTMQMHYAEKEFFVAVNHQVLGKQEVFIAKKANGYLIAVDTKGILRWPANEFDGKPLLVITSENCKSDYHATLTAQGISWIAVGKDQIDLNKAVMLLNEKFGVDRLVLTGGGHINGAFLETGLIDEISLMIAPGIDGRANMASVFDGIKDVNRPATNLKFQSVEKVGEGTVWIRYLC